MLNCSLCLLGGLGLDAERRLWKHAVVTWNDYRHLGQRFFSQAQHDRVLADIPQAEAALQRGDLRFFLHHLPRAARMRVWPLVQDRAVYLDIETTGLCEGAAPTTAMLYDGRRLRAFVAGINLDALPEAVPPHAVLVTYNGLRFDLPRLRRFLGTPLRRPHLDLAPVLRAAGFGPGLKACERQLGVARKVERDISGEAAVGLWARYQQGDKSALDRLLAYNAQDALVLERVLAASYNLSMKDCPGFRPVALPRQPATIEIGHSTEITCGIGTPENHNM